MKMKKIVGLLLATCIVSATAVVASASGLNEYEQGVLNNLKQTVAVDGKNVKVPTEYLNQAESYLNTIDMTQEQAKSVNTQIDEAIVIVKENKITDLTKIPASVQKQLLTKVQAAAAVVDLKVNAANGILKIVDKDGKVVLTVDNTIKNTGAAMDSTMMILVGLAVLAAVGAGVAVTRNRVSAKG